MKLRCRAALAAPILLSVSMSGCASGIARPAGTSTQARALKTETFAYQPAADRNLKIVVNRALIKGQKDFMPTDANWLQLDITVSNVGARAVTFSAIKEQLQDGAVLASATNALEVSKPPSMASSVLRTGGMSAAGAVAGMILFPPAAMAAGLVAIFGGAKAADRRLNVLKSFDALALKPGSIAPGTSVSGYVFVPAVTGQSGLVAFYSSGGVEQSLFVPRLKAQQ